MLNNQQQAILRAEIQQRDLTAQHRMVSRTLFEIEKQQALNRNALRELKKNLNGMMPK
jgi:hypothetical protein